MGGITSTNRVSGGQLKNFGRVNYYIFTITLVLSIGTVNCYPISRKYSTHEAMSNSTYEPIDHIAVFLLGRVDSVTKENSYFHKAISAKLTWAREAKHLFVVTGNGPLELENFKDHKICANLTSHYRKLIHHGTHEVYRCRDIKVLYLPHCIADTAPPPKGSCCRCEGAMRFFHDLRVGSRGEFKPQWMLFTDDDYLTRLHFMHGMVTHPDLDPSQPYVMVTDGMVTVQAGKQQSNRPFYAVHHSNCSVPCTHRSQWMSWSAFSYGAIEVMEKELRLGGLQKTCRIWEVYHDVGLGFFVWYHAITGIPTPGSLWPMDGRSFEKGDDIENMFFHKAGQTKGSNDSILRHDDMLHIIWENGAKKKLGLTEFNMKAFVDYEFNLGRSKFTRTIPMAGFKNSLYYRKVLLSEILTAQIMEKQMKGRTRNAPISITDYSFKNCTAEMDFHKEWRRKSGWPMRTITEEDMKKDASFRRPDINNLEQIRESPHEPKMCATYAEAVQNAPVTIDSLDIDLPPLDELLRMRARI